MPSNELVRRHDIPLFRPPGKPQAPRLDELEPLVEHLTFNPLPGCGELIGYASVELHRLPFRLVLPGWPIFEGAGSELQIGLPLVLGAFPGSRYTALSSPEMPRLIEEVRAALLVQHPDLLQGS